MKNVVLAVSVGCPAGIGPEVALQGALVTAAGTRVVLVGDPKLLEQAAARRSKRVRVVEVSARTELRALGANTVAVLRDSARLSSTVVPGQPDAAAGRAQLAWIDQATDLVQSGFADALVTGPVSKLAIARSGAARARAFLGHTEHLARRLGAREVVMAFASDKLVTALVTTHLPLSQVPAAITARSVGRATYWLGRLLQAIGVEEPRVAIAALNPHAGEGGLLGSEETDSIVPGIALARKRFEKERLRVVLTGPLGAETAFRKAVAGRARRFDGVVAMYHDQATIPSKLLGFGEATNVTLGLPLIRTSVDHGTGYDIAWQGKADARGMIEAIRLADVLTRSNDPPITARASRARS